MLAVGLIYLGKAVEPSIEGDASRFLEYAVYILGIATVGVLIPSFIAKIRLPRNERIIYFSEDGYVADLIRRSFKVSWATTFLSLTATEVLFDSFLLEHTALFLIRVTLFTMLTVMSVTFMFLNWRASRDLKGDGE